MKTTTLPQDNLHGGMCILIGMALLGLVAVGALKIVKSEIDSIKVTDPQLMCSRHGMKYTYARMDICIDQKGQMWSMWEINKGEPVPTK